MKVTGFTFIRNAVKFDYPIKEAIKSILPLCDDFVVAVGNSDDNTEELIQSIDKQKVKIVKTIWDDSPEMKRGGKVFASETDKAIKAVPDDSDWAFYIQGDEVVHEKYLGTIQSAMEKWKDEIKVDGLLFKYLHFYGSYDYVGISQRWYRNEIRVIRNNKSIYSYRDAQGFRKDGNLKLDVKNVDAYMYHYGWVKKPEIMMDKIRNASTFYEDIGWIQEVSKGQQEFNYSSIDALKLFDGTHPAVMLDRIKSKNWNFEHDISFNKLPFKYKGKIFLKKYLGVNTFYENFKII
ncbi:MAG: glycosyltransferase family 2 protein [Bacteroidia bacterium]|nr:glycosyltransferase family 2 protein [Bacteroidia bacterium]